MYIKNEIYRIEDMLNRKHQFDNLKLHFFAGMVLLYIFFKLTQTNTNALQVKLY